MSALRPEIVVARAADAGRLRAEAPEHVPVVPVEDGTGPEALIEQIRAALRKHPRPIEITPRNSS